MSDAAGRTIEYTSEAMEDIAEQLAIRDRFRRRVAQQRTPEERMELMLRLQHQARQLLNAGSEAHAQFLRRNMKKRSIPTTETHAA